uniref:Exosome RNA helicase MTR4 n=1 Tax=Capra hircus TaxID=9925 RepID=A0A8C2P8E8_CAPHI
MADAFGDELFSVFEDDSTTAPGAKKDKEKEKGKWKAPPGSAEKTGKCFDGKLQSESTNVGKNKRDADFEGVDEPIFGKKPRVEESITEDLSLADLMPRVKVQSVETVEGCTHEVALPADEDYLPLKPRVGKAAKEYPFILDAFQREAIQCVDNNQSVLVSAHTSAGKTVCAEYAIALALREKQRVIFTSPIKALSNQKYREMYEEFQDVGLMTGDVTINPTASCLVMTTEILRSMLYRGSEVMREVAWVIFDEIHYMRDSERGVVWEETIILLPDNVHYVFLSATIPNARQFAEWICHLHKQPCHVIYTDYRPTPLQHYIFPAGGDVYVLFFAGPSNVFKIVKMIMERNFQPVIIFSFSKKDCEAYEKKMVEEVFSNAIDCLSDEDKKLPQVENVLPLLKRGIGIHHGGLLPILKETIEILFSEGLIKALFATETFAMGINMPARTVLFTNARKFDGKDFRWISSGEYIQMSGRAGRRGMDDRGIVILMVDEKMSPTIGKQLLKGSADPLNSAFHLTYNMVLNLLRVEEINPEYMLEKSFYQFQHYRAIPGVVEKVKNSEEQYNKIVIPNEESVVIYYKIRQQLAKLGKEIEEYIHKPKYCLPFLQPGRLVKVKNEGDDFGWGVVVNFSKKSNVKPNSGELDPLYVVEVLLRCSKESLKNSATEAAKPAKSDEKGEMQVCTLLFISRFQIFIITGFPEFQKRFPDGVPLLDPIDDMGIQDQGLKKVIQKVEAFEHRMYSHPLHNDPNLETVYTLCEKKAQIAIDIKSAKRELKKARTVLQMDELKCRKRVLRRLGFATSSDVIEMKGRVACEISSADELLLTEMMFNGLFNDLSAEQATALLSCFVFQENVSLFINKKFEAYLFFSKECAKRIAKVSAEAKLEIDEETYLSSFKPHLMDVVYTWATGATFAHICKMTDVFEGSIIRCMRRLEELLRQMCQAAKAIGNTELENKFAEAPGNTAVNKRDTNPCLHGTHILVQGGGQ